MNYTVAEAHTINTTKTCTGINTNSFEINCVTSIHAMDMDKCRTFLPSLTAEKNYCSFT
jgi:hypothetical protein